MDIKQSLWMIQFIVLIALGVYSFLLAIGVKLAPYSKRLGLLLMGFVIVAAIPVINGYLRKREYQSLTGKTEYQYPREKTRTASQTMTAQKPLVKKII